MGFCETGEWLAYCLDQTAGTHLANQITKWRNKYECQMLANRTQSKCIIPARLCAVCFNGR